MSLKRDVHQNQQSVDDEFRNIDQNKEPVFVWNATRAPTSSDKNAKVWIYRLASGELDMYLYDATAGAWRGPTKFT